MTTRRQFLVDLRAAHASGDFEVRGAVWGRPAWNQFGKAFTLQPGDVGLPGPSDGLAAPDAQRARVAVAPGDRAPP